MKRRTVLEGALASATALAMPFASRAQTPRKLSYLTWNIADQEQLFKEEFADFRSANPGVEIEWLDKKGTELPAFYQTQLVAGTAPDVVDLQGAIWVEYAASGALLDLTPYLKKEPEVAKLFFVLRDKTSTTTTYGACRFLYTGFPSQGLDKTGELVLDFNKLENPPCAYTPYATCPLPPPQNRLPISLPVGEQRYHE